MTQSFNVNILTTTKKLKKFIKLYKDILILVSKIIIQGSYIGYR